MAPVHAKEGAGLASAAGRAAGGEDGEELFRSNMT